MEKVETSCCTHEELKFRAGVMAKTGAFTGWRASGGCCATKAPRDAAAVSPGPGPGYRWHRPGKVTPGGNSGMPLRALSP